MRDFLEHIFTFFIVGVIMVSICVASLFIIHIIAWNTHDSEIRVYDGQVLLYEGKERHVLVRQLGENGNKFKVSIYSENLYKNFIGKRLEFYIVSDVEVLHKGGS